MQGLTITEPAASAAYIMAALRRLDTVTIPRLAPEAGPALPVVLAWLAAGRFERVRPLLHGAEPAPSLPLVAARYLAWTGDLATVGRAWDAVRASLDDVFASYAARLAALRLATATELERAATDVGDPSLAATLHARARREREGRADAGAGPGTGIDEPGWAGLVGLDMPGSTSYDAPASDLTELDAAAAVLDFVHGTLGARPDATRHRLLLSPGLPPGAGRITVRALRFGDGVVDVDIERGAARDVPGGGARLQLRIAQESGAIPVTVVLEPLVQGGVRRAWVDGAPADLSPRRVEEGTVVPVQLVLDEERVLTLELEG